MKRNLDLVRQLLLWMEARPEGRNIAWRIEIDGFTDEEIGYHAHLMHQAGLIVAADTTFTSSTSPSWMPISITWAGHEFIAASKNSEIWERAKTHVIAPAVEADVGLTQGTDFQ